MPEVPRGRWPLSSGELLPTTSSRQRARAIATQERCEDGALQHGPLRVPSALCSAGPNLTWYLSLRLPAPPTNVTVRAHFPSSPHLCQMHPLLPYLHSCRPGPPHPGLRAAGAGSPGHPPPSRDISANHTDNSTELELLSPLPTAPADGATLALTSWPLHRLFSSPAHTAPGIHMLTASRRVQKRLLFSHAIPTPSFPTLKNITSTSSKGGREARSFGVKNKDSSQAWVPVLALLLTS